MNYIIGLTTFIFFGSIFSMQKDTGWNPLTYTTKFLAESLLELKSEEKTKKFLVKVPVSYANMRENVAVEPHHFSRNFFERFSQQHVRLLKEIIKVHGWPNFDEQSAFGAWYIAQQATEDPEFQEQALLHLDEILKNPTECEKIYLRTQFAYLYDLVRINNGKEQFYGTACDEHGFIKPIEGYLPHKGGCTEILEPINERRAQMGLSSLQEYKSELDLLFAQARLIKSKVVLPSLLLPEHQSLPTQATDQDCQTLATDSLPNYGPRILYSPMPQRPSAPALLADNDLQL
jgi:hypothetical protein